MHNTPISTKENYYLHYFILYAIILEYITYIIGLLTRINKK